jgi:hypothetical protein
MSNDLMKRNDLTKNTDDGDEQLDAASRLKRELMMAMFKDTDPEPVGGYDEPRAVLVLANYRESTVRDRLQALQTEMFRAVKNLQMKFGYYGPEGAGGVRKCLFTKSWVSDPGEMTRLMGKTECVCGCYVHVSTALTQVLKDTKEKAVRAVVIIGDMLHDDLNEAAALAMQLRRAGTKLFLFQEGNDPNTERAFRFLAGVSGGAHFRFDQNTGQQQLTDLLKAVAQFSAGGKEALEAEGGKAATLLLEKLVQESMPIIEERVEAVKART